MLRKAMAVGLKPDQIDEYERIHAAVWPEVLVNIRRHNITNYSIFRLGTTLFGYYEYVGDEVVLTWTEDDGLRDANCIRVFFDFADRIEKKRQSYMESFGVVPEFKAGVHVGDVVTAEIGDLKRSLVFNGDVLHTGSRIEGQCNPLGKRLLVSGHLLERLSLPAGWRVEDMGEVQLRGKAAPMRLVALA